MMQTQQQWHACTAPVVPMGPAPVTHEHPVDALLARAARWVGLAPADLVARTKRGRPHPRSRAAFALHAVAWVLRENGHSLEAVGHLLGGRDHSSVSYAVKKVSKAIAEGTELGRFALSLREDPR